MGPNYKRPQARDARRVPRSAARRRAIRPPPSPTPSGRICFPTRSSTRWSTTALAHNFDLRIAAERVEEARAQLGITRANQYPFVDAQAGFTRRAALQHRGLARWCPPGTNLSASFTSLGAALSWELDIWGRLRRLTEAARAQYLASEEGRRAVGVSLVSDVMETYFQLLEQDPELEISRKTQGIAQGQPESGRTAPSARRCLRTRRPPGGAVALHGERADTPPRSTPSHKAKTC